jgi:integrase
MAGSSRCKVSGDISRRGNPHSATHDSTVTKSSAVRKLRLCSINKNGYLESPLPKPAQPFDFQSENEKVARAGIEPATRGFSIPTLHLKELIFKWLRFRLLFPFRLFSLFYCDSASSPQRHKINKVMARIPELDFRKTPKGWLVNIPGSLSDTGRFRRRYFKTRDLAKAECQRLKEIRDGTKGKVADIQSDLAADAVKAADTLRPFGVTLAQAALFYAKHHDKRAKAPTLAKAWQDGLTLRKNHRARTKSDFKAWKKALPDSFLAMNCHDITAADIRKALDATTDGATRWKNGLRYVSAILGDVVKAGLLEKNPAASVHVARAEETHDDEVVIYSPEELKALFEACKDFDKEEQDWQCAPCAIPFAVQAFAGIRPEEITKLRWEHISIELGNIRIGPAVAKKLFRRNVRIQPTLAAWLETVPAEERKGKLVPGRWRYKAAKVRKKAGIDGREKQDALRHSFGTYLLATEGDLDSLKKDMGHATLAVYFEHYHKAMTKAEALPYWQILPPGVEPIATIQPVEISA